MRRSFMYAVIALGLFMTLAQGSIALAADSDVFKDNVQLRGSLANSRLKFTKDNAGTVAFLGGSITEMDGFRPMVCANLQKRFPQAKFKFINAGVASTCSTTGAFRLSHDIFADGPVDLLIVEFAVNDDQDAHHTREECIRGMEGIVRHARLINPNIDVIMIHFVNDAMLKTLQAGSTPLTVEAHESVAEHYQIPTIRLASEVAKEISAGQLTWKVYGGVHPAPAGNAICAKMIEDLFDRASTQNPKADISPLAYALPQPIDSLSYFRGRFIDLKDAKITGGWTVGVPDWRNIPGNKRQNFTRIPILSATEPGAEASLDFAGTAIGAYLVAGPDAGMLQTSVDGGPFKTVNLYQGFSRTLHYPWTAMFAVDLAPTKHTLILRTSQETKSQGHAARIMEFVAN